MKTTYTFAAVLMAALAGDATATAAEPHASLADAASELLAIESEFHREIGRLPRAAYEDFAPRSDAIQQLADEVRRLAERGADPQDIAERLDALQSEIYYLDGLFVDIRDYHFGGYGSLWRLDRLIGGLKTAAQFLVAEADALEGYGPPPRRPGSYGPPRQSRTYGALRGGFGEWSLKRSMDIRGSRDGERRYRDRDDDDDDDDRDDDDDDRDDDDDDRRNRRRGFRLRLDR
jgi:hypothetical protein